MPEPSVRHEETVVAHDYLTQRGGAERVALEIARALGSHRIVTSVYRPDATFDGFRDLDVQTSSSPTLRALSSDPRRALPFLGRAWSSMPAVDADVVVSSSSGWAHGVPTAPGTAKIVYCHNPARWLYQRDDYARGLGRPARAALSVLTPSLRTWDQRAARTADLYLANSTSVARRIGDVYGIDAEVLHPPVTVDPRGERAPVTRLEPGYFLAVARPRGYKGVDMLCDAFARLPQQRLAVVGLAPSDRLPENIRPLGRVSEAELRWLYAHARALVSASHEDFGLTPVEANAFGTPSLTIRAGGFVDSVDEGVSGEFIASESVDDVIAAVRAFPAVWDRGAVSRNAERFSADSFGERLRRIVGSVVPSLRGKADEVLS